MKGLSGGLRVLMRTKDLTPQQQAEQIMGIALVTVTHATRCAVNHTMKTSPGALTFRRDMFVLMFLSWRISLQSETIDSN